MKSCNLKNILVSIMFCAILSMCSASLTAWDICDQWLETDSYADINYDGIVDYIDFSLATKGKTIMAYDSTPVNTYFGGFGSGTSGTNTLARDTTFVDTTNLIACDGNVTQIEVTLRHTIAFPATSVKIKLLRVNGSDYDVIEDQDITSEYNALPDGIITVFAKTVDWDVLEGDLFGVYVKLSPDASRGTLDMAQPGGNIKSISGDITATTAIAGFSDTPDVALQFAATGLTDEFFMTNNSVGGYVDGDILPLSAPTDKGYYIILEDVEVPNGEELTINLQYSTSGGAIINGRNIVIDFTGIDSADIIKLTTQSGTTILSEVVMPGSVFGGKGFTFFFWQDVFGEDRSELFYTNYVQGMGLSDQDVKCVDYHQRSRTTTNGFNLIRAKVTQGTGSAGSVGRIIVARNPVLCIGDSFVSKYETETSLTHVGRELLTSFTKDQYIINGGISGNKLLRDTTGLATAIRTRWNRNSDADLESNLDGTDRMDWVAMRDVVNVFVNGPCINDIISKVNAGTIDLDEENTFSVRLAADIARMAGEAGFDSDTPFGTGSANDVIYVGMCPNTAGTDAAKDAQITRIIDTINGLLRNFAVVAQVPFVDCSDLEPFLDDGTHLTIEGDAIVAQRIADAYENNLIPLPIVGSTRLGSTRHGF